MRANRRKKNTQTTFTIQACCLIAFPLEGAISPIQAPSTASPRPEILRRSLDDPTRGSGPGFPWDDVALRLNPSSAHYRRTHRFFLDPLPAVPTWSLALPLPAMIRRRNDRFTAFVVKHTTGLGPFYPPAALCPCNRTGNRSTRCIPFWVRPTAPWACLGSRGLSKVHICWPIPASLAPNRLGAGSSRRSSRILRPLSGGILCSVGSTRFRYQSRMQR